MPALAVAPTNADIATNITEAIKVNDMHIFCTGSPKIKP